jgi:hypothetical protein
MAEKRDRGRPKGRQFTVSKHLRLQEDDARDLAFLVERWRSNESETIRRAIREAAQKERRRPTE